MLEAEKKAPTLAMRVTVRGHVSLNTETPPALSTSTDPQVQYRSKVPFFSSGVQSSVISVQNFLFK